MLLLGWRFVFFSVRGSVSKRSEHVYKNPINVPHVVFAWDHKIDIFAMPSESYPQYDCGTNKSFIKTKYVKYML